MNITLERRRTSLLDIAKRHMEIIMESNEFELEDFKGFWNYVEEFEALDNLELKPYLIKVHMNMWYGYMDFLYEVFDYLGYEEIGRMSSEFGEVKYKFESNDYTYESLFRLKNINADYTQIYNINH